MESFFEPQPGDTDLAVLPGSRPLKTGGTHWLVVCLAASAANAREAVGKARERGMRIDLFCAGDERDSNAIASKVASLGRDWRHVALATGDTGLRDALASALPLTAVLPVAHREKNTDMPPTDAILDILLTVPRCC